jgi:hypothetical protein
MEVLIASSDKADTTATIVSRKSLDDEHSPGVFTVRMFLRFDVEAEFVDVDRINLTQSTIICYPSFSVSS